MKKALLILTSFLWISTCGFSQTNLMAGWDGNGKTGTGSEPNNFGWDCTVIDASTGWTQSGSGANRYMDNAYDYCPGRMLFLRWDAVGGTTIKSIYSYPVELEACRIYIFKGKYAYHNNGKGDFEIGVNSKKDNTGTSLFSGLYTPDTWAFKEAIFSFVPSVSGTYYLTIANPDGATMLGAVSELSMTGIDYPYIGVSHSSLFFDADANKTVQFAFRATNLTGEDIVLTAPSGVTLDKTRIPVSDAGCGKEVLVTATYNGTATFTNQFVTVANQSVSTLKIPVTSEPSNDCFQPQYPGKNLAPDPTFSNPDAMGGAGNRSINKTQAGRCGTSCGFINGGSYNQIIAWKPNTPYMVRARVFANGTNASLGVFDTGEADVKKQPANKNTWETVEFQFISGHLPGFEGGITFQGANSKGAYIDNLEVYEIPEPSEPVIDIHNETVVAGSYTNKTINITGKSELYLTSETPLKNTTINLSAQDDSWIFFSNLRPSDIIADYLKNIKIDGKEAVYRKNIRVAIYKHGAAVAPHSENFEPLTVFTEKDFKGESKGYSLFNRYSNLGSFDDNIYSFKLKKGYMATFATQSDGGGYSRVFIADKEDVEFSVMPANLDGTISFIRVVNWEWVTKKGWCGTGDSWDCNRVRGTWWYSWGAGHESTANQEYVIIRQNGGWPGWDVLRNKKYVSHLLGFNEPDRPDQANMSNEACLAQWPELMKSGLRLGSPAYATSNPRLYQFIDEAEKRNYRVDFVCVHAYWGGKSAQSWYNDLKNIHERTGRPIWITEWNNGANWTTETWPDADRSYTPANAQKQLNDLRGILKVMDEAPFVERYSIYTWVQRCRDIFRDGGFTLAGEHYRDNKSAVAYDGREVIRTNWTFAVETPSISLAAINSENINIAVDDKNEYRTGFMIERKVNGGVYEEVYRENDKMEKRYVGEIDSSSYYVKYRMKGLLKNNKTTPVSNEIEYNLTQGSDIQFGNLTVSTINWNPVLFKQGYSAHPVIILGSPSNKNSAALVARTKQVNPATRFTVQLVPWSYQKVTSISNEESVPYLILEPGEYRFGDLKALSMRINALGTWTKVEFKEAFDEIPVVFVTQANSLKTYATTPRVRNVTKTGFEIMLQKEAIETGSISPEIISCIAITEGEGMIRGSKIKVSRASDVDIVSKEIAYGSHFRKPVFIAQMQTCNDTLVAALRCSAIGNEYARVLKQVARAGIPANVSTETAGWLVIEADKGQGTSIETPETTAFSIYPNPVENELHFTGENIDGLEAVIYTTQGVLLKKETISNKMIHVEELQAGTYLIKIEEFGSTLFIKR